MWLYRSFISFDFRFIVSNRSPNLFNVCLNTSGYKRYTLAVREFFCVYFSVLAASVILTLTEDFIKSGLNFEQTPTYLPVEG